MSVAIKLPPLAFQETALPLADLRDFALRERAALWWVSNQSDDLLCLPHCRIRRLEYQVRTALRVLGPLRGRALLSDEVGLGKTIEAGLVLKELLTRGMVKKFLVLTLPSLVDQWAEELNDKFGVATVTTNQPGVRDEPARLWRENPGIVASLHTRKQPAQLAVAREVHWDLLIVDEAHYLRNRDSQAWQAVNVLPRQFLLLLTATPVQNSLEELYNLVTLLMPGQLPTPREFRARFLDPKRPRQPREPEELRRLLGQVMIRNIRANAGVDLPPRHAETVIFVPDEIQAIDQHWALRRVAISLPDGFLDEGLAREIGFARAAPEPPPLSWPTPDLASWSDLLQGALLGDLADELAGIRARQEQRLRRELDRIDAYFETYAAELSARASRSATAAAKTADPLAATRAEHARHRADQVTRHEIAVHPHLDALLLVAEPAWRAPLQVERGHRAPETPVARYVPRARRWVLPG